MNIKDTLLEMSEIEGISGDERAIASYSTKKLNRYGEVHTTSLGSVICTIRRPIENQPHFLLDAHMDEIGMIVTYIDEKGFLKVSQCGTIDRRLLLASSVTVYTARGPIPGIVCSIPPHLQSADDSAKTSKVDDIAIDIGYDYISATRRVSLGDRVGINSNTCVLNENYVSGKALDNRASCVALMYAAELLYEKKLNCGLSIVFSTMEETGGQGAMTACYEVNPTHAIAVDVSFAHTPDAPRHKCGDLSKGPMIGYAPILNKELTDKLKQTAIDMKIPYQIEVMGGSTGTNSDKIASSRAGVKTALISIPQKYMHTPIETVAIADVKNTARLIADMITKEYGLS